MKLFLKTVFLGFLIALAPSVSYAQAQIELSGIVTTPAGLLKNSSYGNGIGAEFKFLTGSLLPDNAPLKLRLGIGISGSRVDGEKYEVETEFPVNGMANTKFINNNNAMNWILRGEKQFGRITVYGDLLYGRRNLHSLRRISLQDDPLDEYENDVKRITESKMKFWGFGSGISYSLSKYVLLDFSMNYTMGNGFSFLAHNTIMQDNNQICYKYEKTESSDILTYKVGVRFNIVGITQGVNGVSSGTNPGSTRTISSSRNRTRSRTTVRKKKKIKVKTNPGTKPPVNH